MLLLTVLLLLQEGDLFLEPQTEADWTPPLAREDEFESDSAVPS